MVCPPGPFQARRTALVLQVPDPKVCLLPCLCQHPQLTGIAVLLTLAQSMFKVKSILKDAGPSGSHALETGFRMPYRALRFPYDG